MNAIDPQALQIILDESLNAIKSGQETIDSILEKYPDLAQELRPALEGAMWLNAQRSSLEPRPGFISASRARLVADLKQNHPQAVTTVRPSLWATLTQLFQRKYALQFALVFIIFIGFVSSGVVFVEAANRSIPGDVLYTSKLVIEETQLAIPLSKTSHIRLEINFAERRSNELQQLARLDRYEFIPQTATRFDDLVVEVVNELDQIALSRPEDALTLTASLQTVVDEHLTVLTALVDDLPREVSDSVQSALVLTQVRSQSINELIQKIVTDTPQVSPTLVIVASNTPVPTLTPTPLLTATATQSYTLTATSSASPTPTPTPTATLLANQQLPLSTATDEPELGPTDTPEPTTSHIDTPTPTDVEPTPTVRPTNTQQPPTQTPVPNTPTQDPGDPTDIPLPTNTTEPPDPTDISLPTDSLDPPDPTDIPDH